MREKDSHCSFCGTKFSSALPWPRTCAACGCTTYRNPIPVVVALAPVPGGLIGVRRNLEPQKGLVALPGGYLDYGESWQAGASRELREETGIDVPAADFRLFDVLTAPDGTLVIFGLAAKEVRGSAVGFFSAETLEVTTIGRNTELCFELHTQVVARYFAGKDGRGR